MSNMEKNIFFAGVHKIVAQAVVCMLLFAAVSCDVKTYASDEEYEECEIEECNFEATDHWWFQGKKYLLQRMDNKFHIVFFSEDIDKLKNALVSTGAVLSNVRVCREPNVSSDRHASSEITRATIEGYYDQIASALAHTIHWAPYFRTECGREVWIANSFSIRLKSEADFPLLEELAKKHRVVIVDGPRHGWYILACTLLSTGNALEMANLFYETGLFASYDPHIIGLGQLG